MGVKPARCRWGGFSFPALVAVLSAPPLLVLECCKTAPSPEGSVLTDNLFRGLVLGPCLENLVLEKSRDKVFSLFGSFRWGWVARTIFFLERGLHYETIFSSLIVLTFSLHQR